MIQQLPVFVDFGMSSVLISRLTLFFFTLSLRRVAAPLSLKGAKRLCMAACCLQICKGEYVEPFVKLKGGGGVAAFALFRLFHMQLHPEKEVRVHVHVLLFFIFGLRMLHQAFAANINLLMCIVAPQCLSFFFFPCHVAECSAGNHIIVSCLED